MAISLLSVFIVVINCISVRLASKLAGVLSITKIVGLVIIIITGLHNLTKGKQVFPE